MRIVFGLGNPGENYRNTRHNVGFMVVQRLAEAHQCRVERSRFQSLVGEAIISGHPVILAVPQTYMNRCGPSLKQLMEEYSVSAADTLVVCDDFNLGPGQIRIRPGGSSGGHNGLKSITEALETPQYPRLRIGIGGVEEDDPIDFVLGNFSGEELEIIHPAIDDVVMAVETWIASGIDEAMNRFNRKDRVQGNE